MTLPGQDARIRVVIEAVDRASQSIRGISREMDISLRRLGRNMILVGGVVTGFTTLAINAATNQRVAIRLLSNTLELLGDSYMDNKERIDTFIQEQERLSKFTKTDLTDAFTRIVDLTGNVEAAFRALPVAADVASGMGKSIEETAAVIARAMTGEQGAINTMREWGLNIKAGITWTQLLTEASKKFGGAAQEAKTPIDTMKQSVSNLAVVIGQEARPMFDAAAGALSRFVGWSVKFSEEHPKLFSNIVSVGVAAGGAALALGTLAITLSALGIVITSLRLISIVPLIALMSGPLGLAVAIAGVGTALMLLTPEWKAGWKSMEDIARNSITIIKALLAGDLKFAWDEFLHGLKHGTQRLIVEIEFYWDEFIHRLYHGLDRLKQLWNSIPLLPNFGSLLPQLVPTSGTALVSTAVASTSTPLPLSAFPAGFADLAARFGQTVNLGIPNIAMLQHGGIVMGPTMALLGERGPEAVVPLGRGGQAGAITVVFNGPVYGLADFDRAVAEAWRKAKTHGGFHGLGL